MGYPSPADFLILFFGLVGLTLLTARNYYHIDQKTTELEGKIRELESLSHYHTKDECELQVMVKGEPVGARRN